MLLEGTGGVANPAFPQEAGIRTRVEGFTTDDSRGVDAYAIDIDCNGIDSSRDFRSGLRISRSILVRLWAQ